MARAHWHAATALVSGFGLAFYLVCGLVCGLAACSSSPKANVTAKAIDRQLGATSIFVQFSYERGPRGELPPVDCALVVAAAAGGRDGALPLPPSERDAFAPLAAGSYAGSRIECAGGARSAGDSLFPGGFRVEAGRIAYLGRIVVSLDAVSGPRARIARRQETFGWLRSAIERYPQGEAARMISAFTGKPLAAEMVDQAPRAAFDLRFKVAAGAKFDGRPMSTAARNCVESELARNPVPIGALVARAAFSGTRATSSELSGANAYTDEFAACVKAALLTPRPARATPLEAIFLF